MRDIEKYDVFQLAHGTLLEIYALSKRFPADEKYGIVSQIRRAAYSITSNLIEGSARSSEKDFRHFVNMAYASCAEAKYLICLSKDLAYIQQKEAGDFREKYDRIQQMLFKLRESVNANGCEERQAVNDKR